MNDTELKKNLKSTPFWLRGLFMLAYLVVFSIFDIVLWVLTVIQFLFVLLTGGPNAQLTQFGSSLSAFVSQIIKFLSYNTEEKPFPFTSWPQPELVPQSQETPVSSEPSAAVEETAKKDVQSSEAHDQQPASESTTDDTNKKLNGDKLESTEAMLRSKSVNKPDNDTSIKPE